MGKVHKKLEENLAVIKKKLGVGVSFDVTIREFKVAERAAALVFIDGFPKDVETIEVMKALMRVPKGGLAPNPVEHILNDYLAFFELNTSDDLDASIDEMLAGPMLLLIDGVEEIIILDLREYPIRGIEEPDLERVTRGSRDGFVETAVFNTTLVRRRIRDKNLRFEVVKAGERSQTDIFIGYISDIADPELVKGIKQKIQDIKRDALPMGGKNVAEYITGSSINPLPKTRYTERPDVAAAHLYEGHVLVFVDTTPFALIFPVTAWHFTQHAEEYFQIPIVGTYLRWVRSFGILLSLYLIPLWIVLSFSTSLPPALDFIGAEEVGRIPLWLQFLILEYGLDLLRMALVHTPNALATSLGIVGAILLGDLAVGVGLFAPEPILYIALTAIGSFGTPSIEFAMALRLFRYLLFAGAIIFGWIGLGVATLIMFAIFATTKSFNVPYLWPLLPLDGPALLRIIFRYPIPRIGVRPRMTNPQDIDTKPKKK